MVSKPCPRCKKLIPAGLQYCDTCKPIAEAQLEDMRRHNAAKKMRAYNAKRDPKYAAFRNSKAWRDTSKAKLRAIGYKCEARLPGCTGLAVEVHHIKPISTPGGWAARLEWANLEGVCTACHNGRHPEKGKRQAANRAGALDMANILKDIRKEDGGGGPPVT